MSSDTDLSNQPDTLQQPPRAFKKLKVLTLIIVLLIAVVVGTGGYLLGIRNNQSIPLSQPSPAGRLAMMTPPLPTIESSPYQDTGWVSPTVHINYQPTSSLQPTGPTGTYITKSQAFSPDGKKIVKIFQKEGAGLDITDDVYQRYITISDSSGANEKILYNDRFNTDTWQEILWSPDSRYIAIKVWVPDALDLYVFKADGSAFSNGKTNLRFGDAYNSGGTGVRVCLPNCAPRRPDQGLWDRQLRRP